MEDRKLIQLLQSKPSEGLREAIQQYGGLLQTVISRIIPNSPQDVEECVADTFINGWKTIHRLDADGNLKGYLLCIARNTAINRYRQLKRQNHASLDILEFADEEDVALSVIGDETLVELQNLIASMTEPDREIIIRKYFLFESLKEIGSRLGMADEQVKKRLYRSRQRLKAALEKRGVSDETI